MTVVLLTVMSCALVAVGFLCGQAWEYQRTRSLRPRVMVRGLSQPQVIMAEHDGMYLVGRWPNGDAQVWVERCRIVTDGRTRLPSFYKDSSDHTGETR